MKTVTRPVSFTTQLFYFYGTSRQREISDWAGLSWTKRQILKQNCVCSTPGDITWMDACMPTSWMPIWAIILKNTKCFSSLTETHACNPSCLITTFDSFVKPFPPPASLSLCRISFASKKITKWYYFLHPFNIPFPSAIPPMTYRSIFPTLLSTPPASMILSSPYFMPISIPCHLKYTFLYSHKKKISLTYCISKFLRDSGAIFGWLGWKGKIHSTCMLFSSLALTMWTASSRFFFFPKKSSFDPLQPIFYLSTTTKAVLVLVTPFPGQSSGLIV